MWKTYDSFVRLAARSYGLQKDQAAEILAKRLRFYDITATTVECYINWADGNCLTQKEIGRKLRINQSGVSRHLAKIKSIWPYLFQFGAPISKGRIKYHAKRQGDVALSIDEIDHAWIKRKF